jgi:uncharacterized lipoprotein YddW (UPF0748 family)
VRTEYRAFWIDTFNSTLNNHADIVSVVGKARAANANALFVQVRRRGDAWFADSLEPPPDFVAIDRGYDPLADLVVEAHAAGIEVHAWVIAGAVWNKNPSFAASATLGPPLDPRHVFNLHGGYDSLTQTISPGPENWLTRTLLPDSAGAIGFQGHRFGSDFWLDFGHPDAATYTVDVLLRLVRGYEIDGLHLDRIRYPEFSVSGVTQSPGAGVSVGYNAISVARFQRHYGIAEGSAAPAANDPRWSQWRRDQVTNLVRRVYLNAMVIKPRLKVSASLIAFGSGPVVASDWNGVDAYWRVFQDWRAWTEEGILDIAVPMNYKREHVAAEARWFDQWMEWARTHTYGRAAIIGQAVYLNAIEGTLRQARRSLAAGAGVALYSMANTNEAVTANPWSVPAGANTPVRSFADFAAGLATGRSADGTVRFEEVTPAVFAQPAFVPLHAWKVAPRTGHLMGVAAGQDTARVTIENIGTGAVRTTATDGGGFFGAVDLAAGTYSVRVEGGQVSCVAVVSPGAVTRADAVNDRIAPVSTAHVKALGRRASPVFLVRLSATDECSGVARIEYSVGGSGWTEYAGAFLTGAGAVRYRAVDRAGNVEAEVVASQD